MRITEINTVILGLNAVCIPN